MFRTSALGLATSALLLGLGVQACAAPGSSDIESGSSAIAEESKHRLAVGQCASAYYRVPGDLAIRAAHEKCVSAANDAAVARGSLTAYRTEMRGFCWESMLAGDQTKGVKVEALDGEMDPATKRLPDAAKLAFADCTAASELALGTFIDAFVPTEDGYAKEIPMARAAHAACYRTFDGATKGSPPGAVLDAAANALAACVAQDAKDLSRPISELIVDNFEGDPGTQRRDEHALALIKLALREGNALCASFAAPGEGGDIGRANLIDCQRAVAEGIYELAPAAARKKK